MLARIRDAEHTQCMAELTHKLCNLELKVAHWAAWLAIRAGATVNHAHRPATPTARAPASVAPIADSAHCAQQPAAVGGEYGWELLEWLYGWLVEIVLGSLVEQV